MLKTLKFTPELTELIKAGKKNTTWRLFDEKNLTKGDRLILATREGEKVTQFGTARIKKVVLRTIGTLQPEDYIGHESVTDPLKVYQEYYGDIVNLDTEVKIIEFDQIEASN